MSQQFVSGLLIGGGAMLIVGFWIGTLLGTKR